MITRHWWVSFGSMALFVVLARLGVLLNSLFLTIYFGSLAILLSFLLLYNTVQDALNVEGESE